jgi:sigma-B regulation protein RsbU (phosphoserine phosphatase)
MAARMSAQQRRVVGLLVAVALVAGVGSYAAWRMRLVGRDGWAGFAYIPDIKTSKDGTPQSFAGYRPGMVFMVYPGSPAERAGIERMSRIVSINGIPPSDMDKIGRLSKSVRAGSVLTYRTESGGKMRDIRVRFDSPVRTPMFAAVLTTAVVVALTYLLIGTFVFWRLPRDARAIVFFAMTLIAAASFIATVVAQFEGQSTRGLVINTKSAAQVAAPIALAVFSMFFAPLLLHLALIFPKPRPVVRRGRTLFTWIYGIPIYGCLCLLVFVVYYQLLAGSSEINSGVRFVWMTWSIGMAIAAAAGVSLWRIGLDMRRRGAKEGFVAHPLAFMTVILALVACATYWSGQVAAKAHSPVPVFILTAVVILAIVAAFGSYPVATLIALLRSYRGSGPEERRQVKWPLWGTMIVVVMKLVLVIVGLVMGLLMTFGNVNVPNAAGIVADILGRLLYILIPLSFAFAILKYRLMNIDVIIRRTVLYTILSAIVFVLYGVLVAGVGTLLIRFARVQNTTMVIASTIVVALVAVPLRNRLQQMVDRNLFRERRDYPLALRNIGDAIGSGGGDVEGFLQYAAEQLQHALQTRFVAVALRREEHFVIAAKVGIADEVVGRLRIPASTFDPARRDRIPDELRRLGTVAMAPVSVHREPLGFVASGSKLSDQEMTDDDLQFLGAAASQIALGIENSRLRTEEAEFAQARAIQQVLLPTQFPRVAGFEITGRAQSARSVGGDYFDILALGDGKVAVCIGDVAGKGMPAALLMANLQAAVKATAGPDVAPSQLCEKVKRVVGDNLSGGKFISFFYGVIDSAARTITYSNAGHNQPILARANGEIERLSSGGPAFGRLFRDELHEQGTTNLARGDRLVLFTDGASESRRGEEEFGEDRLAAFIAAHRTETAAALHEKIVEELTAFTSGNFSDDVTLVVVAAE